MFTVTSSLVPTSSVANCPSLVQVSAGSQHPYAPIHPHHHPHHHPTHHVQLANPMHHHHIHHLNSANVAALIAAGHHVAHHPMSNSSEFGSLGLNGTPGGMASNGWHQYSAIDPYAMKQAQGAQQQYADYHLLMSTFAAPPPPPPNANSSYSQCNNSNNRTLNNGNCTSNSHYSHSPYSSLALDKHSNSNGQQQPNGTHHQHHNQYGSGNISAEPTARLGTKESSATVTAESGALVSSAASLTCSNSSTSNSSALTSSSSSSLSSPLSSLSPATGVTAPCTTSSSTAITNKSMSPPVASSNSLISSYCPLPMATSTSAVVSSPAIPALIPASSNSTCTATANYIAHPVQQHSNAHSTLSSGAPTSAAVNNNNNHSNSQQLASSSSSSSSTSNYYQPIKDTTFTKIFVGGLPYHTTDKSLRAFFETFGELEEAVVITDRQTGKSRGYGFVTMADRDSAERAVKEANPIIDGRKANVNLAYLGAKPRNGYLTNGYPFSSLSRSSATASTATGAYATFPSSNATAAAFGPGSQFGFAAQPHIVYHPGSASLAGNSATSPPGTFLPPATPTGLILTPPGAFYADYGLGPGSGTNTNPFAAAAASGYADATILTPFLTPTFAPSSSIVATSTAGHHHQQHYSNGNGGHHSSQQAIAAAAAAALVGMTPSASVSSTVGSPASQSNSSAASAAAATAAAAAFYLNGPTTNGFLTGAYLTDTRI